MLILEIENAKKIERITVNRHNAKNFRYEEIIKTGFGSATVRSFDSRRENDQELADKVNDYIKTYIPKFLR